MNEKAVFTKTGLKIASNFTRIVRGERGNYVEILPSKIISENVYIPKKAKWRLEFEKAYYVEYRSDDKCNVKIYYQKELVNYADYKIGYYYVSIKDVYSPFLGLERFIKL